MTKTKITPGQITISWHDRDGGWWKVMQDGRCLRDFRERKDADAYRKSLTGEKS